MAEKRITTEREEREIELELKRLQIDQMREDIASRNDRKARASEHRQRQIDDYKKGEVERLRRQRACKHRKGGKNNHFANGNDANYSIITNTYPTGQICITCTRCGKEVWKPDSKLKKTDSKLYAEKLAEWQLWSSYPTDNTPSGSKIFEVVTV